MSAYDSIRQGLNEAMDFAQGETSGARVHQVEVPSVDVATVRVTRYEAVFVKIDGLDETAIGGGFGLKAERLEQAESEALGIVPPAGTNFVKILDEGRVVRRLGFGL